MEAQLLQSIQPFTWVDTQQIMNKPGGCIRISQRIIENRGVQMFLTVQSSWRTSAVKVSASLKNSHDSVLQSRVPASLDESLVLKNKAVKIEPYLNGRCIYLVDMMGSGKTTIGRILSEVLGYSFYDRGVAGGFCKAAVSYLHGGGAVIRLINWKHMRRGVSAWLDVPLECLARRISAVGTGSRPLLHGDSGDAYSTALTRLSSLLQERHEAYANASTRVSLEQIAAKLGYVDVDNLSPVVIAIEVLQQIENFLKDDGSTIRSLLTTSFFMCC